MKRIESFLSARLFLVPQLVEDRIYFISNLSGRNSLYVMDRGGSVPEPLLPPDIALQNPHLMNGRSFVVFPQLGKIVIMLDQDGDENYLPMMIPLTGGYPEPIFAEKLANHRVSLGDPDLARNNCYFIAQSRTESIFRSYLANLETGELIKLNESQFGGTPNGSNKDKTKFILGEGYGVGDGVLFRYNLGDEKPTPLLGTPMMARDPQNPPKTYNVGGGDFIRNETGLLVGTSEFEDTYGLAYLPLDNPEALQQIPINGIQHEGVGELEEGRHLLGSKYLIIYNIDGCSWAYEAEFDEENLAMQLTHLLCGKGKFAGGVLESIRYNKTQDEYVLSFSTAVSPTQIYTISGKNRDQIQQHTRERILGLPQTWLSPGEDYPFTSYDGLRISARLYMPAAELGYEGSRPLIYYIHGGPQSQERPDFAWFSMPFIQYLTLNGFAVFVPNVRGSTGYGFAYMKHVVRDWGGKDRLDHVHAMTEVLPKDDRLDTSRAGVCGRSYGGYMTLTLASRHPELWSAAIDMFGPYDLLTFASRVPETWKPFIKMLVGDPETEQDFMRERSPRTYIEQVTAPMLVVQGKNDPRVIEQESRELVEHLQGIGKEVEYLMFPDEGHDVLKYENRVNVYTTMTDFFKKHLGS
ncbi:prolyl oligopeptidase family serine peptidase [Candidatus Leptofilum sp.]|uniref:S9 family peptidase n=1 Tax=Candidatus Leptofilum sp. TaxID=3241576 RepID=UPI003B5CED8A